MAKSPNANTMPPIKLGASKWRTGGAIVVLVGTVGDEVEEDTTLDDCVEVTIVVEGVVVAILEVVGCVVELELISAQEVVLLIT